MSETQELRLAQLGVHTTRCFVPPFRECDCESGPPARLAAAGSSVRSGSEYLICDYVSLSLINVLTVSEA